MWKPVIYAGHPCAGIDMGQLRNILIGILTKDVSVDSTLGLLRMESVSCQPRIDYLPAAVQ